jgi:hypothetical protein
MMILHFSGQRLASVHYPLLTVFKEASECSTAPGYLYTEDGKKAVFPEMAADGFSPRPSADGLSIGKRINSTAKSCWSKILCNPLPACRDSPSRVLIYCNLIDRLGK